MSLGCFFFVHREESSVKRVLVSLLVLVVLATVGLFVGKSLKKNDVRNSQTSSQNDSDRIYHIVDKMPQQINSVTVQYPKDALEEGIEGDVHVKMIIDEKGNVEEAEIYRSSGVPSLDQAALETAKLLKFSPALVSDVPVRMRLFKLFQFDVDNVEKVNW